MVESHLATASTPAAEVSTSLLDGDGLGCVMYTLLDVLTWRILYVLSGVQRTTFASLELPLESGLDFSCNLLSILELAFQIGNMVRTLEHGQT